jgi:uncharacterized membrane protein YphA (DoxX/SURF4 family)
MTYTLWTVQVLLALIYVFSGSMKLIMPIEEMTADFALPEFLLRFIGVAEVTGGLGLVLPGLFRIRTELTPLAAAGLTVIMIGAVIVTAATMGIIMALIPLVVLLLTIFVGYGRWKLAPHGSRSEKLAQPPAAYGT